jgi:hypothetical protein
VRAILEQSAAPIGSWREKRRRPLVAISAFVGMAGSFDLLLTDPLRQTFGVALHALVGLDLNFYGGLPGGTIGLYIHILDIGNLASVPIGLDVRSAVVEDGMLVEEVVRAEPSFFSIISPVSTCAGHLRHAHRARGRRVVRAPARQIRRA